MLRSRFARGRGTQYLVCHCDDECISKLTDITMNHRFHRIAAVTLFAECCCIAFVAMVVMVTIDRFQDTQKAPHLLISPSSKLAESTELFSVANKSALESQESPLSINTTLTRTQSSVKYNRFIHQDNFLVQKLLDLERPPSRLEQRAFVGSQRRRLGLRRCCNSFDSVWKHSKSDD